MESAMHHDEIVHSIFFEPKSAFKIFQFSQKSKVFLVINVVHLNAWIQLSFDLEPILCSKRSYLFNCWLCLNSL